MFLPYSSDIYEEYPPWMGYFLFAVVIVISFILAANEQIPEIRHINLMIEGYAFPLEPILFIFYFFSSFLFWWVFGKSVCSKTGNILYLIIAVILTGLYVFIQYLLHDYYHSSEIWGLSWIISFVAGMYLVFWPSNNIDCFILIPPWRTFSASGFWIVLYWLLFDAVFCALFRWQNAFYIHPVAFLTGIFIATFLIRIRVAIIPRDESSLWDVLFRRRQSEESWKFSWKERKSHVQQEQERQEFLDEQFKKKLASSKQFSKSSSNEKNVIFLCDCGQVIVLDELQETFCPSCGRKLHQGHRQK